MKNSFAFILIMLGLQCPFFGFSQSTENLFITKELKNALKDSTRTYLGVPGVDYWQNRADYSIKANLNPFTRILTGSESIKYFNNSPDTLKAVYFNLIQDIFKRGVARDWDIGQVDLHNGIRIKKLIVDGESIDLNAKRISHNSTKMRLSLRKFFYPHTEHSIEVDWSFIFPSKVTIRMGRYDSTNYMVAYWYPKIAVYDDISGWAKIPHTGNCEFYHEFGNYNVEITEPDHFIVWSTGVLQNAEELFRKKYLRRIEKSHQLDSVISIVNAKERRESRILKPATNHLWKFKAANTPDFAFAISNQYIWDAVSVNNGIQRVAINTVYNADNNEFSKVASIARNAIKYYSLETPKIPYPYPQITLFNGDGGMEFPGMVNDGNFKDIKTALYVTSHEIGHSYFPFNTGLNEQSYAWMDEGMITFLPRMFVDKYANDSTKSSVESIVALYNKRAGTFMEIPLMVPSTNTGFAYRYQAYNRSSVAFLTLYRYLGKEKFNKALRLFAKNWEHKHPVPFDFFFTFNKVAGEDLAWFWKPWFFDMAYADLSIGSIDSNKIEIVKKGDLPVGIHLSVLVDGKWYKFERKANVWKNNRRSVWIPLPKGKLQQASLDCKTTADAFPEDNLWKRK